MARQLVRSLYFLAVAVAPVLQGCGKSSRGSLDRSVHPVADRTATKTNTGGRDVAKSEQHSARPARRKENETQTFLHVATHGIGLGWFRGQPCGRGDDGGRAVLCQSVLGPAVAGLDAVRRAVELDRCAASLGWSCRPGPGDWARLGAVTEYVARFHLV